MLESGWMLLVTWLIFSYISGYAYSRRMTFKLYMEYRTHYEVIVAKQKNWFNDNYWIINTVLHHGLAIFFAVFGYSVIAFIFGLNQQMGWYIGYATLFLAIAYRYRQKSFDFVYKTTCSKIDNLLEISGYSVNISELKKSESPLQSPRPKYRSKTYDKVKSSIPNNRPIDKVGDN